MHAVTLIVAAALAVQLAPRMQALVSAVRPVLPFPAATADGDLPADRSTAARWFVIWPAQPDDTRVIVRANPLHPDVQKISAEAMEAINAAVAAAERRAQASYDRALEQLRKTGKAGELETVTLEDEGAAGERIDAELEVIIELADAASFAVASSEAPLVQAGANGVSWMVTIPANSYRPTAGDDRREHFRAAETHLYFGVSDKPVVSRPNDNPLFHVAVAGSPGAFSVIIRGQADLVAALTRDSDWSRLASR